MCLVRVMMCTLPESLVIERKTMWYYSVCVERVKKMFFEVLEAERTSVPQVGRVGKMLCEFCYLETERVWTCLVQMEIVGS